MSPAALNAIYDVLVDECGAYDSADARSDFAVHWPACGEYRFQGKLGFGGKVWSPTMRSAPKVTCYPEDRTDDWAAMIERANERLARVPLREE